MIKKDIIKSIGEKEMDRKDFLKYSGLALVAVIGLRGIINLLTEDHRKVTVIESRKNATRGFGGGRYGV